MCAWEEDEEEEEPSVSLFSVFEVELFLVLHTIGYEVVANEGVLYLESW